MPKLNSSQQKLAKQYFEKVISLDRIFDKATLLPTAETALDWLSRIYADLSPENLSCDGECSPKEITKKQKELMAALAYCENILGRKVSEEEIFDYESEQRQIERDFDEDMVKN